MSEGQQFIGLVFAALTLAAWVLFYRYGGWKKKVWRRYVGGIGFPAAVIGNSLYLNTFNPWFCLGIILYPAWLSMGYGDKGTNDILVKIWRRGLFGLVCGVASASFLAPAGLWGVLLLQTAIAVAASLYYGIKNPLSAVGEEGTLGAAFVILTVFSVIR